MITNVINMAKKINIKNQFALSSSRAIRNVPGPEDLKKPSMDRHVKPSMSAVDEAVYLGWGGRHVEHHWIAGKIHRKTL